MKHNHSDALNISARALLSTSPIPGWLEQIALDDLADSIETWTRQMTDFHNEAGAHDGDSST